MPTQTRAAVLRSFAKPMAVERVELRDPGPGEVLVRMVAAGVCHSDVGQADGDWSFPLPAVLGHEGAGVVQALGANVAGLTVGQHVVLSLAPGCGTCPHCLLGRPILCQAALGAMGAGALLTGPSPISGRDGALAAYSLLACFADHAIVSARSAIPLPEGVPAEVAALMGCAVITGLGAAVETIEVAAGSRGGVIGAGGVGLNAVQGARLRGAAEVIALDPSAERRELAGRFGATSTVDPGDAERVADLIRAAPTGGWDWAIVTVGAADAMRLGVELTRPGGTAAIVGLMPEGRPVGLDLLDLVTYERRIVGSAYGSLSPQLLMPRILELYRRGRLRLDEQVTERLPLEAVNEAFALSRAARGVRPVLTLADGGGFA